MADPCPTLVMAAVLTYKVLPTAPGSGTKYELQRRAEQEVWMLKEMVVGSGKVPMYISDCNTRELLQSLEQKSSGCFFCMGHLETLRGPAEKAGRRGMELGPQAAWCI